MSSSVEGVVNEVSEKLRKWIHDVNNSLFVTKGFMEEIEADFSDEAYKEADYDKENLMDMIQTINRNVDKIDKSLQELRNYAKSELFKNNGIEPK